MSGRSDFFIHTVHAPPFQPTKRIHKNNIQQENQPTTNNGEEFQQLKTSPQICLADYLEDQTKTQNLKPKGPMDN